ncbi:hypothetical protein ACSU1N_06300 [Thermogladius sp. 4427co]|uniref:hypothetical protein n=1 Tax=Thermogladius sp. 4427co TaxID=3450718 RepID=UPI003F798F9A
MAVNAVDRGVIEISLRQKKKVISVRAEEVAVDIIDRYLVSHGLPSRTMLLGKIVEAIAKGLDNANGRLREIRITLVFTSPSQENSREVVIKLAG